MKREKGNIKKVPQKVAKQAKSVGQKQAVSIDFFEKYLNRKTLLLLGILIFGIGFIAFKDYFNFNYLFFFKDIGSDSINQDLPGLINKTDYLGLSYFQQWSFYQGMGNNYFNSIPIEPLSLFSFIIYKIGYSLFGPEFVIQGRFLNLYFFHFVLSGFIFYYYFNFLIPSILFC